jgi:molecular chaperone GrpE
MSVTKDPQPERTPFPAQESIADTTREEATIRDLEDRWRRALADFDNLNKRMTREILGARQDERRRVVAQLLPVVDNLERALEHAGADPATLLEGVRAVRDQAVVTLAHLGFVRGDEVGVPFDPARHEAVATEADPAVAPGTVVRVVRPGYGNGEAQLRPAAVVVATRE